MNPRSQKSWCKVFIAGADLHLMKIPLHSVGEHLVAGMIKKIGPDFFKIGSNALRVPQSRHAQLGAQCESRLALYEDCLFDGRSSIDIVLNYGGRLYACEVKLGNTSPSKNLRNKYLLPPKQSNHRGKRRWSGNMISILANFQGLRPNYAESSDLSIQETWFLIVRETSLKAWKRLAEDLKTDGRNAPIVICFEDLVAQLPGDQRKVFNVLVKDLLPTDAYREWLEAS